MNSLTFRLIFAGMLIAFVVHRGYYTRKIQHAANGVVEQPDLGRASQFASILALLALVSTLVYIFWPAGIYWSALTLPDWLRWVGIAIGLSGFILLQWAQQALGQNWSDAPQLQKSHALVTTGPYRWVRHPIYSAFVLFFTPLLLVSSSWLVGGLWLISTGLDIAARVTVEERMLTQQFGEQYRTYATRTGRILPRFKSK